MGYPIGLVLKYMSPDHYFSPFLSFKFVFFNFLRFQFFILRSHTSACARPKWPCAIEPGLMAQAQANSPASTAGYRFLFQYRFLFLLSPAAKD